MKEGTVPPTELVFIRYVVRRGFEETNKRGALHIHITGGESSSTLPFPKGEEAEEEEQFCRVTFTPSAEQRRTAGEGVGVVMVVKVERERWKKREEGGSEF
jgi:hypothetical protein